jgi:hypothetical protein
MISAVSIFDFYVPFLSYVLEFFVSTGIDIPLSNLICVSFQMLSLSTSYRTTHVLNLLSFFLKCLFSKTESLDLT